MVFSSYPLVYAKENTYGIRHFATGIFTLGYFCLPFVLEGVGSFTQFVTMLRMTPVVLSFAIMIREHWKKEWEHYFSGYYYLFMGYAWSFVSVLSVLLVPQGNATLWHLSIGVLFLGMMVDWRSFVVLELVGTVVALVVHWVMTGLLLPNFGHNGGLPLLVSMLLPCIGLTVFNRYKDQMLKNTQHQLHKMIEAKNTMLMTYESSHDQVYKTLHKHSSMMSALHGVMSRLQSSHAKDAKIIERAMDHFFNIAQRSKEFLRLNITRKSIHEMLDHARTSLLRQKIEVDRIALHIHPEVESIVCDATHMVNLLVNAVLCMHDMDVADEGNIDLWIDPTTLYYEMEPPYEGKTIPAIRILCTTNKQYVPTVAIDPYTPYAGENTCSLLHHMGMVENKRIIGSHYGYMNIERTGKQITQTYVVPRDLKAVRPTIEDFAIEDLEGTTPDNTRRPSILKGYCGKKYGCRSGFFGLESM